MKTITIKGLTTQVQEMTSYEFSKKAEETERKIKQEEAEKAELIQKVKDLEKEVVQLKKEIENIYHQFAVDHGESEN